ncbi:trypsin-like peptidase domain-containing protein [Streptomyces bathyalis]|uniref:Trypsin-like peptidase domain-containing protein n=2 Tax=Streptomyces bathyalis TaxID=2710756 RepID=A0A7T1T4N6_9ACTN|nr:trypsin-like peptidase domain-containing protein [Streptomyces bathyalis]QPP06260.1 trypsin-like peptidase domain-containing protein [Streptomyces bathyalis]
MMGAVLAEQALVRICDLAGRARGTGFVADGSGTVITSHEAVDGLGRVVVHARGERSHLAESDAITRLPEWDLALIRTEGLGVAPLLIGAERPAAGTTRVRLFTGDAGSDDGGCGDCGGAEGDESAGDLEGAEAGARQRDSGWTEAELAGRASTVTYISTDRFHDLEGALELTLPGSAAARLRLNAPASGSPVLDTATGAVLAVLGTALHAPGRRHAAFAVPLRPAGLWEAEGQLGALLSHNGATVPGYGPDLNLAGALRLTAATVPPGLRGSAMAGSGTACAPRRIDRPEVARVLREFSESGASVTALVGRAGSGRTTELAALAAARAGDAAPAPTVWLRGAHPREGDGSVREALGRVLGPAAERHGAAMGGTAASGADVVARLARDARRPLLVLLDGPEEMPAGLARDLRRWATGTSSWLRAAGARMLIACGPEQWAELGELLPGDMLFGTGDQPGRGDAPPCVRLGDLSAPQAASARELYGLGPGDLAPADAGHPLALRMLGEIRAAQEPGPADQGGGDLDACGGSRPAPPTRDGIFSAYLALVALRIARTLSPGGSAGAVRRLAARTAGALHQAARRGLGTGQGALSRGDFEEIFPTSAGWAEAVLRDGVLEAVGEEFRFADEEFGEWLQGRHLDVDAALETLVHRRRSGDRPHGAALVPRHRIGRIVHALVLCDRVEGANALERRLRPLADAVSSDEEGEAVWWAGRLLRETLLRVPDARPYYGLLRGLAEHFVAEGRDGAGVFGPSFWRRLALPTAQRIGLLRLLLPADAPHSGTGDKGEERYLHVVGELLAAEPHAVQPLLCGWFTDRRRLAESADAGSHGDGEMPRPTVASAAQALLYTHRRQATDMTLDLLTDACHPRADELLGELAQEEPSALCRAVERWAHDDRTLRQIAAAEYGPLMARHVRSGADREHLRRAARALLRIPGGSSLHGPAALAMLLRLPHGTSGAAGADAGAPDASAERDRHLDAAVGLLATTGSAELADALVAELSDRPAPALAAFKARLCEQPGGGAHHLAEVLAAVRAADLAVPTAEVTRHHAEMRPETAGEALAAFVRGRLAHRPQGCEGIQMLIDALQRTPCAPLRAGLARALRSLGGPVTEELLGVLLLGERDPAVLEAALEAAPRRTRNATGVESHVTGETAERGPEAQPPAQPQTPKTGPGPAGAPGGGRPLGGPPQARVPCVSR